MADVAGDATTTVTITPGGPTITDAIETVGDEDWYRIELTAGQRISIAVNVGTLQDPYLYLRDSNGALLAENDDAGGGQGSRLVFTAPTSGNYYIDVAAWTGSNPPANYTGTGTYTLSVANYVLPPVGTLDDYAYQLTTAFFGGETHHFAVTQGGTITVNFSKITAAGKAVALAALQLWTDIIGVNFVETSGTAQIDFDDIQTGTGAFADTIYANGIISSATVNVALSRLSLHTYMHEIGHALGIGHTSNANSGTAAAIFPQDALWANDASAISIQSYFDNGENVYYSDLGFSNVPVVTPQVADIIAMGNLYGLSTNTRLGNTTYGFNNTSGRTAFDSAANPNVAYTIFDSGGIDTLDYSGFGTNQLINLNAEAFSNIGGLVGNVVIARGTLIENAIGGSGNDILVGNVAMNVLRGNAGADTFRGTAAQLNGDTIADLKVGDELVFSDAALGSFAFSMSGETLTYAGGSLTLTGVAGNLAASAAAGGGVSLHIAGQFSGGVLAATQFGSSANAGTWSSNDAYPRNAADVNGDGRADIVGFGNAGVYVSLSQPGGLASPVLVSGEFGAAASAGGWASNAIFPRQLADINGDHRADIVAFGDAGVFVSLGQAGGAFAPATLALHEFGAGASAGGWANNDIFTRLVGDVNGDGRADIVGFGYAGTYVALGQAGGGFSASNFVLPEFGYSASAGGWQSDNIFPRLLGDVNGDNRADIIAFGEAGVYVSLGQAGGGFGPSTLGLAGFGHGSTAGSWSSNDQFPRLIGDVNGDHFDDIVGFGNAGAYVALGRGDGTFDSDRLDLTQFGAAAGGWSSDTAFPRILADMNGDGYDDIIGFGDAGVVVAYSAGDVFP